MGAALRERDLDLEARERHRYLVLSRVLALSSGDIGTVFLCSRIADDLSIDRSTAARLFSDLIEAGYLRDVGPGPSVSITPQGILYLERRAGRRHSVRAGCSPVAGQSELEAALRRILAGFSSGTNGRWKRDSVASEP
jgi:DNA-binding MarR family transcriptional regulator